MIKIPTPEEITNIHAFKLIWECVRTIEEWFVYYKQKKIIISVDIGSYSDETVDIVIAKLGDSGWLAKRETTSLINPLNPFTTDKIPVLIIKDKRDIL